MNLALKSDNHGGNVLVNNGAFLYLKASYTFGR